MLRQNASYINKYFPFKLIDRHSVIANDLSIAAAKEDAFEIQHNQNAIKYICIIFHAFIKKCLLLKITFVYAKFFLSKDAYGVIL